MTPQEFKAWFDGFTEAVEDAPSRKQWARIKERVAEIDGKPVTEKVYVDRYLPSYPYAAYYPTWVRPAAPLWNQPGTVWCNANTTGTAVCDMSTVQTAGAYQVSQTFDSLEAMNALGKTDATLLS